MEIWHFCRSPVVLEIERGGVSNVVAQLSIETAAAGISTHVVCSNRDLGIEVGQVGVRRYRGELTIHILCSSITTFCSVHILSWFRS